MKLCPELLTCICESIALNGSFARAAQAAQISESTLFHYIAKSKEAEKIGDKSQYFFRWRDVDEYFAPGHIRRAKSECVLASVYAVMEEQRHGRVELVYDPSSGRPVIAENPDYIGLSDAEMIERGLHPKRDRLLWVEDELGERTPVFLSKTVAMPASLRAKVLSGIASSVFGDRVDHSITHRGAVTHVFEPSIYRSKKTRIESGEVIDAECTPALERPDIAELRARAARLQADLPNRRTVPDAPVLDANLNPITGRPRVIDDKPDDKPLERPQVPLDQHPRAYQASTAQDGPPRPRSYIRDPHAPGARAMKITK